MRSSGNPVLLVFTTRWRSNLNLEKEVSVTVEPSLNFCQKKNNGKLWHVLVFEAQSISGPMQLFFSVFLRWQSWWQRNACWNWKRRSPSTTRTWTDPSPLRSFPWFVIIYKSELKMQFLFFFLNQALKAMGRKSSRVEVKDMIGEADADGNGTIEFSEFAALMEKWVVILWSPLLLIFIIYSFQNLANAE